MMSDKRQIKPEVGMEATVVESYSSRPGRVIKVTHNCKRVVIETKEHSELVFTKRKISKNLTDRGWGQWYYKIKGSEFVGLILGVAHYYEADYPR